MQNLQFPLNFTFKIFTPSNDFTVFDAQGEEVAYTRQKIFKIKESIEIFRNSSRNEKLYTINADRIIDFNASYTVRDAAGRTIGSIKRSGMKSLWKTSYTLSDAAGNLRYTLHEANPWVAVVDGIVGEIPFIGMLTGYFLNPTYTIATTDGRETYRLKKNASFLERKFSLEKTAQAPAEDDVLVLNAAMLLMLLERGDG
ncbi:MAG: hypothetical protein Q4D78_10030 [Neisseria zoodegmatis]|uniref:hypothetical protein n=1 Tax=Neisseria zoodegmatis TaxID=326523 RepID=UPI0026EED5F0|nr:hypothetical protein [Neisseria zoodegmatis]MDO5070507.1 hypothetical protein [Neisseria zoodegmatis]